MPYTILEGIDNKGKYVRSSEKLHYKKYHYKTERGKQLAIAKVRKQNLAILLSELKRGKIK